MSRVRVAVDARLYRGTATGDSTYWTGLIDELGTTLEEFEFLYFTNVSAHGKIPAGWHLVPGKNRWWSLVRFPLAARRLGARLLHTQYSLSPLVGRSGVTTIHDVSFYVDPSWFRWRDLALLRRSIPGTVRRAAAILTVSETSKREIEAALPAAKGKTVAGWLGPTAWIEAQDPMIARKFVAERFGLNKPFALSAATNWARKNTALAIEAVRGLQAKAELDLALAGKAQLASEPDANWLHGLGYVSNEELANLYSAASVYLLPSLHEGFGLPILEAWTCGTPVVAMAQGAVPEVGGPAVELVDSRQAADWTTRIACLLDQPGRLQELRAAGAERLKLFTWAETAKATAEAYRLALTYGS